MLVALGDALFLGVYFPGVAAWVIVGAIIATMSVVSDMTLLDRLGHVGGFVADTAAPSLFVWAAQFLLPGSAVTWFGAIGTGLLPGLSEIVIHRWV